MTKFLVIAGVILIGVFIAWLVGVRRAVESVTGRPTPEAARVDIDAAKAKAQKETQAKVNEVKNETPDEALRRARDRVRRGLLDGK